MLEKFEHIDLEKEKEARVIEKIRILLEHLTWPKKIDSEVQNWRKELGKLEKHEGPLVSIEELKRAAKARVESVAFQRKRRRNFLDEEAAQNDEASDFQPNEWLSVNDAVLALSEKEKDEQGIPTSTPWGRAVENRAQDSLYLYGLLEIGMPFSGCGDRVKTEFFRRLRPIGRLVEYYQSGKREKHSIADIVEKDGEVSIITEEGHGVPAVSCKLISNNG